MLIEELKRQAAKSREAKANKLKEEKKLKEGNKSKQQDIIKTEGKASTSFLQRKLQIGYNRAARIVDMMEEKGIVSKANHVGKREVL